MNNLWILAEGDVETSQGQPIQTGNELPVQETGTQADGSNGGGEPPPPPTPTQNLMKWAPMIVIMIIMYMFIFRGPKKKQQQRQTATPGANTAAGSPRKNGRGGLVDRRTGRGVNLGKTAGYSLHRQA